ncbi:hypothetical protein [Bradyrhizobium australiense]|uniref:hypothetical protein n=1 Tax=Bradyrhizobium australiense TaxID=2721161 RepID=UPI0035E08947
MTLGATAVGISRPYAYGLALGGVEAILHVLRLCPCCRSSSILADGGGLMAPATNSRSGGLLTANLRKDPP